MTKAERIDFVQAGLRGYDRLSPESKKRTSKPEWIALKLGCSLVEAERYVFEAEKSGEGER